MNNIPTHDRKKVCKNTMFDVLNLLIYFKSGLFEKIYLPTHDRKLRENMMFVEQSNFSFLYPQKLHPQEYFQKFVIYQISIY